MHRTWHTILISVLSGLVALTLLFSLGLHSIQISHQHHAQGDNSQHKGGALVLGEYMHASEKKLLLILILTILLLGIGRTFILKDNWITCIKRTALLFTTAQRWRIGAETTFYNYIQLCFCRGILHPKLY